LIRKRKRRLIGIRRTRGRIRRFVRVGIRLIRRTIRMRMIFFDI
jgi:hypothetical protein